MKKWTIGIALLWCLLLSCQPTASGGLSVQVDRGCDSTYKPGEVVNIHYKVFYPGWVRIFKQYPDLHEEEFPEWRFFPFGGEHVESDTLGPECGRITYTVILYQEFERGPPSPGEVGPDTPPIEPCYVCGPTVVYVKEVAKETCSINVECEMGASLYTDKAEYIAGADSEAKITLDITDVHGNPLDADSVVFEVNGIRVRAIESSPGVYTGTFTLSDRPHGEYLVTATVSEGGYAKMVKTTTFALIVPVMVELSTDRRVYDEGSQAVVQVKVEDFSGEGVTGLYLEVDFSGGRAACADMGGGIYEALLDLSGLRKGRYTVDIVTDERYIRIDSIRRAEFVVGDLPEVVIRIPDHVEVNTDSTIDVPVVIMNVGEGDALNIYVSVIAPPGIEVQGASGYSPTLPAGNQTTALVSLMGKEEGKYTVNVEVSYQDVGGDQNKASSEIPVDVTFNVGLLVTAAGGAAAVGAGAYLLKGKAGTKAAGEILKKAGQKIAKEGSQKVGTKVAAETASLTGSKAAGEAAAGGGIVKEISKKPGKCTNCGFENPPDSSYCSQCGAMI